jgi:hypothetical protein
MKNYLFTITALLTIFFLSACKQPGWDKLEETNLACFAAREKFIARDMDSALQILAPHNPENRTLIQATLAEAKVELAKLSDVGLGDLMNAVVTVPSSSNTNFSIGTDGIHFNQGTSSVSTTFKYKRYEVVFACNFERNYGAWTTRSINWSTKKLSL